MRQEEKSQYMKYFTSGIRRGIRRCGFQEKDGKQ